jgi:NADH-ubiquinone oxidoreductase chain 2
VLLFSSFLSLIVGSVLGLSQFRIKRLYAYSTISHVGFILLALSIHSVESVQAFFFYIIQYSLSNLNAFVILVVIGYSYVNYVEKKNNYKLFLPSSEDVTLPKTIETNTTPLRVEQKIDGTIDSVVDMNNFASNKLAVKSLLHDYKEKINNLSPIEYIDQLKGYFYLNPVLALSLSVTLYSFIGIPPLVGFFAKQMILSSALDNGYIFMCLIAILTSVISAVYYLYIIKHMFFEKSDYVLNEGLINIIKDQLTKIVHNGDKEEIKSITLSS